MQNAPMATTMASAQAPSASSLKFSRHTAKKHHWLLDCVTTYTVDGIDQPGVYLSDFLPLSARLVNPGEYNGLTYTEQQVATAFTAFFYAVKACGTKGRGHRHTLDLGLDDAPGATAVWVYTFFKAKALVASLELDGNAPKVQDSATSMEVFVNGCTLCITL